MVLSGGQHTLNTLPLCFIPAPPTEDMVEEKNCLGNLLGESLWKAPEAHALRTCTFIKWLEHFFLSWYYRRDTITRFINSLFQGLSISQCDGLMHITLTLTSGALSPPHTHTKRFIETQNTTFPFVSMWICFPFLHFVFLFSLPSAQQAFLIKESKKVFDLHPHFVSACILLSILTFLSETKMSEGRWMDYLFSSQSPKSSEKHQSPFKLSRILSRSRSRAQKSTTAYGSYIRSRVWGPLHLLVELREQAENMMVIRLPGPLSSHRTCSHKCLLPLLFVLPESLLLATVLCCSLLLPFILAVQPCV